MMYNPRLAQELQTPPRRGAMTPRQFTLRRRRGTIAAAVLLLAATSSLSSCSTGGNDRAASQSSSAVHAFSTPSPKVSLTARRNNNVHRSSDAAGTSPAAGGTSSAIHGLLVSPSSDSDASRTRNNPRGVPPGSPLEMICKDQHEFELQVGRAMDTLRDDYPYILTKNPNYSIYDPQIELVDPSGVRLHGVKNYKNVFRLLHAIVGIFYCPERSGLTFRMCFDKARRNIRIHWNAQVIPKAIFGGYKTTLYADGISVYELDPVSGNITKHRLERLVINDSFITPEIGIFAALRGHAEESKVDGVPVFNVEVTGVHSNPSNQGTILQFLPSYSRKSVLFSNSGREEEKGKSRDSRPTLELEAFNSGDKDAGAPSAPQSSTQLAASTGGAAASFGDPLSVVDLDALERKNLARKKFGLKPLTPEEYIEVQEQVTELDNQQKKKAAAVAADMANRRKPEESGFFNKLFESAMKSTCETNFDCSYPEVCCDFGFKKMCCSSGLRILEGPPQSREGQYAEIPVPASNPFPDYPNDPRGRYY